MNANLDYIDRQIDLDLMHFSVGFRVRHRRSAKGQPMTPWKEHMCYVAKFRVVSAHHLFNDN